MIFLKDRKTGNPSRIVAEIIEDSDATLSLKLSKIETDSKVYIFNYPVLFQISEEEDGTIIENELLDIFAAGHSITEAKSELSFQFDHSFQRLNELSDAQLSSKLLLAKGYFNFIVKEVISR